MRRSECVSLLAEQLVVGVPAPCNWETIVIGTTLLVAVFLVDFFKKLEFAIH